MQQLRWKLARGAAVAESVNITATVKEQFFMSTSTAVVENRLAEPTDNQLVTAMLKMIESCPERKQVRNPGCFSYVVSPFRLSSMLVVCR